MIRLENWAIVQGGDIYTPPELQTFRLIGLVYGHPAHGDGSSITTSTVMHADGREILTRNHKYILGTIKQEYKEWHENEYSKSINEDCPFG